MEEKKLTRDDHQKNPERILSVVLNRRRFEVLFQPWPHNIDSYIKLYAVADVDSHRQHQCHRQVQPRENHKIRSINQRNQLVLESLFSCKVVTEVIGKTKITKHIFVKSLQFLNNGKKTNFY